MSDKTPYEVWRDRLDKYNADQEELRKRLQTAVKRTQAIKNPYIRLIYGSLVKWHYTRKERKLHETYHSK